MGKRWPRVVALAVVVVAVVGLVWVLVAIPELAGPVEAAAVVLGTGFTAFAAYSAWQAARVSRAATSDALRRERGTLQAERLRIDSERTTHEAWLLVAMSYDDEPRKRALTADIATGEARAAEIDARLAEIATALGE